MSRADEIVSETMTVIHLWEDRVQWLAERLSENEEAFRILNKAANIACNRVDGLLERETKFVEHIAELEDDLRNLSEAITARMCEYGEHTQRREIGHIAILDARISELLHAMNRR